MVGCAELAKRIINSNETPKPGGYSPEFRHVSSRLHFTAIKLRANTLIRPYIRSIW